MQMSTVPESAPFFYGRFLTEAGRGPEGLAMLQEAVARTPTYLPARSYLLKLYYVIGSRTEVEALARGTLAMFAGDSMALAFLEGRPPVGGAAANVYDRGVALTAEARHLDAGVAYRRYLDETGPDADAFLNLGWSQAKLGFDALAAISFREVLAIRPDDALARNNLTWVEQRMGGTGIVTPP
jgi:tetratricopeptide (TPR) repeat protein